MNNFIEHLLSKIPNLYFINMLDKDSDYIGYKPSKSSIGIAKGIPAIQHEMAHMIEMNDFNRLIINDWGLADPKWLHRSGPKGFFRAMAREARVRGIAHRINNNKSTLVCFNNPAWFDMACKRIHFGRFKCPGDVKDWSENLVLKTFNNWPHDRIEHEWTRRIEFIRNWQETK